MRNVITHNLRRLGAVVSKVPAKARQISKPLGLLAIGGAAFADGAPTITPAVDVGSYVGSAVTVLGGIIGICVAAWFGFVIIRAALKWARSAVH